MRKLAISRPWLWFAVTGAITLCLIFLGLGVAHFILGSPEYDFVTEAVYEAPVSGYRIEIHGRGVVRSGRDLSDESSGTATIGPIGTVPARPVQIRLAGIHNAEFTIEGLASGRLNRSGSGPLAELLGSAGYGPLSEAEVRETHALINGVLAGPKGTTVEGQSKHLRVVSVRFR